MSPENLADIGLSTSNFGRESMQSALVDVAEPSLAVPSGSGSSALPVGRIRNRLAGSARDNGIRLRRFSSEPVLCKAEAGKMFG